MNPKARSGFKFNAMQHRFKSETKTRALKGFNQIVYWTALFNTSLN